MVVLGEPLLEARNLGLGVKADAHAWLGNHVGAVVVAAAAAVEVLLLLLLLWGQREAKSVTIHDAFFLLRKPGERVLKKLCIIHCVQNHVVKRVRDPDVRD